MKPDYSNPAAQAEYIARLQQLEDFPFAFTYGGTVYRGFDPALLPPLDRTVKTEPEKETTCITFTPLGDTLTVKLKATFYPDFGVSEWTVYFANTGTKQSGILTDAHTCLTLQGDRPVLRGIWGDHINWYRPYEIALDSLPAHFATQSGRPTHISFPYFNLEAGDGGALFAIGWAGSWKADFVKQKNGTNITLRSTNDLYTRLNPGEELRTALFVYAPYTCRNEHYATNLWRSWFLRCNLPPVDATGAKPAPFSTCCFASDTGLPNTDGSISENYSTWRPTFEKMLAEDVKVDFRWVDAGWYQAPNGNSPDGLTPDNDWHNTIGTWRLDPKKWPENSFRQSTDFARQNGMKTLMWFEPERLCDLDNMVAHEGYKREWAINGVTNNIGDPDCLAWTTARICDTLRKGGIEMYREDNNSDPGPLWRTLDARQGDERHGFTECKMVQAHYKMWDDIIACTLSIGGCGFVDSCASGGGRNDLESLRRGIPLLRSDYDRTTTAMRLAMTSSFNKWVPFCGTINKEKASQLAPKGISDPYVWRASYLPVVDVDSQFVQDDTPENFEMLRFGLHEWQRLREYLIKDYYVLTPWHGQEDNTGFTAFGYFDPEQESGILLLFRQEGCEEAALSLQLPYLQEDKTYELKDEDTGEVLTVTGAALRSEVSFQLANPRTARLIWLCAITDRRAD